mgnify:CR=1 FL=1
MKLNALELKKKLNLELLNWSLTSKGEIVRSISRNQIQGKYFGEIVESIWTLAEEADHHPGILLQYNEIKISLITHDECGITSKDIKMAKKIDSLLLRFFKITKI